MAIRYDDDNATDRLMEPRGRRRIPALLLAAIVTVTLTTALYHVAGGLFGTAEAFRHRTTHVALFLIATFLFFPLGRRWDEPPRLWTLIDAAMIAATLVVFVYRMSDVDGIASRSGFPAQADVVTGTILILLVLEAVRRTVGTVLLLLPVFFMVHALFSDHFGSIFLAAPTRYSTLIGYLSGDLDGMLGVPIAVSSSFIVIFMIYGAVLVRSGGGAFFTDIAYCLAGGMTGGSAKAAALASGLYGTLSGSTTANVVTTGSFTIPLMKSTGFSGRFAASVEAMASNGGQIVPPVMGAAAFIIPMYIPGSDYRDVVIAAAIPAVLYFLALLSMIHFEARRTGLHGVGRETLPRLVPTLVTGWPILLAFGAIVAFLMTGFTPMIAGSTALVLTCIVTLFRAETRMSPRDLVAALENGVRTTIPIVMACAAAGLIIGSMDLSGLAGRVTGLITLLAGDSLVLTLVVTAVVCIILGMGMTTTIIYITLAALVVPSLVRLGAPELAANLFVFYFGCLSGVTPPVALTTYAAAGIARSDPWTTGLLAVRIGFASFLIPFMMIYSPGLLMQGPWYLIVMQTATAAVGVVCLAAAVHGHVGRQLRIHERLGLAGIALLLVAPTATGGAVAVGLLLLVLFSARLRHPEIPKEET